MTQTIVLAYSGGLDTSIIVPWLKEHYDARIVCVAGDIGQGDELAGVREKAIASGADECYIEDLRQEFVSDFIWPTLRAGAIYGRKYLLGTSMGRPLLAKRQVEVARRIGADALAHGCTGKGNDQVRFELTYAAFAPELPVIAPWRVWDIRSREDAIAYAKKHNVPVTASREKIYSRDRNIWHISHEGGVLEDPAQAPPDDLFMLTTSPELAPNEPENVTIGFNEGTPVAVNGTFLDPVAIVASLNEIGGRHGIGRIDIVEDRLVGRSHAEFTKRRAEHFSTQPIASSSNSFSIVELWLQKILSRRVMQILSTRDVGGQLSERLTTPLSTLRSSG